MLNLNVGAGGRLIPGFDSVDVRHVRGARRGHAADLSFAPDGAVRTLFANAVLEHLYVAHHLAAIREWKRVIDPEQGCVVLLGIPDAEQISRLYLERQPGIVGPRFDLYHVYRYTHGDPELAAERTWQRWNPARRRDSAPRGFMPQLHKAPLDAAYVGGLFARVGLHADLFNYAYPGESYPLNLGVVAGSASLEEGLDRIPTIGEYLQRESVVIRSTPTEPEGMLDLAQALDSQAPLSRSGVLLRRARNVLRSAG